jgi:GAF domain-containing protein
VVQNRKAALIYNTRDDPRWLPRSWDNEGKSRSAVSVPLMENEKVLGVLTLVNSQGARFTEEDLTLLATIAVFISLINYS